MCVVIILLRARTRVVVLVLEYIYYARMHTYELVAMHSTRTVLLH